MVDSWRSRLPLPLGRIVATTAAVTALVLADETPFLYLVRHASGDFGDVDAEDAQLNRDAIVNGDRVLSAYTLSSGERIWIITEADRSITTILLPSDY